MLFELENILGGNQFFGFLVPVPRTNRRNAKLAGADEFVQRATTHAEVSCGIADLEHIGSSDSLLAVPAYLFDDVLGPTAFLNWPKICSLSSSVSSGPVSGTTGLPMKSV